MPYHAEGLARIKFKEKPEIHSPKALHVFKCLRDRFNASAIKSNDTDIQTSDIASALDPF